MRSKNWLAFIKKIELKIAFWKKSISFNPSFTIFYWGFLVFGIIAFCRDILCFLPSYISLSLSFFLYGLGFISLFLPFFLSSFSSGPQLRLHFNISTKCGGVNQKLWTEVIARWSKVKFLLVQNLLTIKTHFLSWWMLLTATLWSIFKNQIDLVIRSL